MYNMKDIIMIPEILVTYISYVFKLIFLTSIGLNIGRWLWDRSEMQKIKKELKEVRQELSNRIEFLEEENKQLRNRVQILEEENQSLRNRMVVLEVKAQNWDTIVTLTQHFRGGSQGPTAGFPA